MSAYHLLAILLSMVLCLLGCEPDITVCELPEELNTCESDDDCLLAYCGIDCCGCERVASERQFDETYCMVRFEDGPDTARRQCQEARDTVCDDVTCIGTTACAHPTRAECNDAGRCIAGN
jgi:hypothetical protein